MIGELWPLLLQLANWFFLGLIYLVLLLVILVARWELQQHVSRPQAVRAAVIAPGRLRVLAAGNDPHLVVGNVLLLDHQATIGGEPDNSLILHDEYVSGHHARLRWDGAHWWVEDLGSRNGTLVDGRAIPPHRPQQLPFNVTLEIGDVLFKLLE